MSSGIIRQFLDYAFGATGGDDGQNNAASIDPMANGEDVVNTVLNRSPENLRQRTEAIRSLFADTLFLRDDDRGLLLGGPGLVSWSGGILSLSDVLYLVPALTPGSAQSAPIPPVASVFGSLTLLKASAAAGITVVSQRRSYAGGDQINVTVVPGASFSAILQPETVQRSILITAASGTQLSTIISALNGLTPSDSAGDSSGFLVTATLAAGAAGTDTLLTTQAKQYVSGNYDGEGHAITPSALATFFGIGGNALTEGDTLCIQYASLVDDADQDGRRQSIPENSNTAIPAGSFFNSRVNPERLVNAVPIAKVLNGRLVFVSGQQVPSGASGLDLGGLSGSSVTFPGGVAWADGTANPATTVTGQLTKILSDLASESSGSDGANKIGVKGAVYSWATRAAENLYARLTAIEAAKSNLNTTNSFTATQSLDGGSDTAAALQETTAPVSTYKLWFYLNAVLFPIRVYYSGAGNMLITVNAAWVPGTSKWHQDNGSYMSRGYLFSFMNYISQSQVASSADWLDSAWVISMTDSGIGGITATSYMTAPYFGASGNTVGAGYFSARNSIVAWAIIQCNSGTYSILNSAGLNLSYNSGAGLLKLGTGIVELELDGSCVWTALSVTPVGTTTPGTFVVGGCGGQLDSIHVFFNLHNTTNGAEVDLATGTNVTVLVYGSQT